jgi:hypothetical protein
MGVSVTSATMSYIPTAENASAQAWQIIMHHGMGYVSGLTLVGALAPMLELSQLTSTLPDFASLYYHNRMWEFGRPQQWDRQNTTQRSRIRVTRGYVRALSILRKPKTEFHARSRDRSQNKKACLQWRFSRRLSVWHCAPGEKAVRDIFY